VGNVAGNLLSLTWQAVGGAGISYAIDAGTSAGASNIGSFSVGTATSFSSAVPPGTYFIRVRAVGACGSSPPTNEVMLTVAGPTLPSAPTNFQATVSGSTVMLSWQPPAAGAPITTYIVEVGLSPATPTNLLVASLGPGLSFTANAPRGIYFVRMRAQNSAGVGPPSDQISVVVP
jgi:predicted phage tail protein